MDILEWTKNFAEYRHNQRRELKSLEIINNKVLVTLKDKNTTYTATKELIVEKDNLSCLNTKKNFEFLLKNWAEFVLNQTTIFFVNTNKNTYWAIKPYHHQKIAEKKTLKTGLKALFESTEILNE